MKTTDKTHTIFIQDVLITWFNKFQKKTFSFPVLIDNGTTKLFDKLLLYVDEAFASLFQS